MRVKMSVVSRVGLSGRFSTIEGGFAIVDGAGVENFTIPVFEGNNILVDRIAELGNEISVLGNIQKRFVPAYESVSVLLVGGLCWVGIGVFRGGTIVNGRRMELGIVPVIKVHLVCENLVSGI